MASLRHKPTLRHSVMVLSLSLSVAHLQAEEQEVEMVPPVVPIQIESEHGDHNLEVITITARSEETLVDTPQAVTVVNSSEMLERAPRTAAEALRYKPGIWIQKTGHVGGAPVLRGFMGNRVIYMFDDVRRNTASLFGGPNSFLQNIDALDIDRIEVIRGPGSVLYGSDAIGGVINVQSIEKAVYTDELKFGGRSYARSASVDQEVSLRQEMFYSSSNMFAAAGITSRDIGSLEGGRGRGLQDPSGWEELNGDAQINYLIKPGHEIELAIQSYNRDDALRYDKPNNLDFVDRDMYKLSYRADELGSVKKFIATLYYQDQQTERLKSGVLNSQRRDKTFGLDTQATSLFGAGSKVIYGLHYNQDNVVSKNPDKNTADPEVDWTNPAAFALVKWQTNDRLRIDVGIRVDQLNLQSNAPAFSELDTDVQNAITSGDLTLQDLELDVTDTALTGGIGLVYALTDEVNVVSHIGRAFRAPTKSDMLRFGQFTFGFNVPTTGIDPESSWTYELGIKGAHPNLSYSATGFYTIVKDGIVSNPGTFGGLTYIDVNNNNIQDSDEQVYVKSNSTDDITAYGIELEGNWYLPEGMIPVTFGDNALSLYGNATWMKGKDKGANEPLSRGIPTNALVGIRLEDSRNADRRRWWISAEAWMVASYDDIPSNRLNKDGAFKNDPQNSSSGLLDGDGFLHGFMVLNLRSGIKITDGTTLTLAVENLADKDYRVKDSRIDAAGINFVTGLEVKF